MGGYPTVAVHLVREWTEALGTVVEYLQKRHCIDLIQEVKRVERRVQVTVGRRIANRISVVGQSVFVRFCIAMAFLEVVRFVVRRKGGRKWGGLLAVHLLAYAHSALVRQGMSGLRSKLA